MVRPVLFKRNSLRRIIRRNAKSIFAAAVVTFISVSAFADDIVEPHVFASSGGVLDLLMVAKPQAIPTISFNPPNGGAPINPVGWVYEVCPRPQNSNVCPAGGNTVADYGGVRLALQQGDALKIRLVNQLPMLDPLKAKHSVDPGGANLPLNPTNLHTHGLIVPPRVPTLNDPTFGDYVFVELYNPANGTPLPQASGHQHGSVKMDFIDYRIDIPANHPSGAFWFHPHIHGLSLNQITGGMAGIITVGNEGEYIANPPATTRHLILKDMQVLAGGSYQLDSGTANFFDGEVQFQESGDFCEQYAKGAADERQGSCPGSPPDVGLTNSYIGGRWYFPVNGQLYPTINVNSSDGELWRLTNASGQVSYRLGLIDNSTKSKMLMQLVSIDGVSISIPPGTAPGTIISKGGNRFSVASSNCPTSNSDIVPVCIEDLVMMPSSRAEVWVIYRDANGNAVTPPAGASAVLRQLPLDLGPAGEKWPIIDVANVVFNQNGPASRTALTVIGNARAALSPTGIFGANVASATPVQRPAANCLPLANGHRRRIFFGVEDPTDPDNTPFGLGYEEVDENNTPVPGTFVPVRAFDPAITTVCIPLNGGGQPVTETWELVSLATEIHNFHIHQTKFTVLDGPDLSLGPDATTSLSGAPTTPTIMEDNAPVPFSTANIDDVANNQGGYCTVDQWRNGDCVARKVIVQIPFSQLGDFVYHCHILEHEDGGMMAKIRVVPNAYTVTASNSHDYNGDGKSDIAWRDTSGNIVMWLMDGSTIASNTGLGNIPSAWSIVGHRDFNADGKHDWFWRDRVGNSAMWLLNGNALLSNVALGNIPQPWSVVATGDFNGDTKGDVLWRDSNGNLALWLMNGGAILSNTPIGNIPTSWSIVGAGDFNRDGKADLLWRDASGNLAIWLMDGATVVNNMSLGNIPTSWSVAAVGDFNGDNTYDILWRDSSGNVAIWLMNNGSITSNVVVGNVPSEWTIVQTGDYDGDGRSDILWRNRTGDIAIWFMRGGLILSNVGLGTVPVAWTVQSTNAN